jgi:hypothetical protein
MSLFKNVDPAEAEARAAQKAAADEQRREEQERKDAAKREAEFNASPSGQARRSFERGDHLFQVSFELESIGAAVRAMEGAYTRRSTNDPSRILNGIAAEGWTFQSLSTAFVSEGEVSRDKFMSSGQQVAVRGRLVGTYVFTRRES